MELTLLSKQNSTNSEVRVTILLVGNNILTPMFHFYLYLILFYININDKTYYVNLNFLKKICLVILNYSLLHKSSDDGCKGTCCLCVFLCVPLYRKLSFLLKHILCISRVPHMLLGVFLISEYHQSIYYTRLKLS